MYTYTQNTQLRYKKYLSWTFSTISSDSFYSAKSPLFYLITALLTAPFFRNVRHVLGVADHNFIAQMQIYGCICIFNIALSLGICFLLKSLDKKYSFTQKIILSKFFKKTLYTGLYIENFLRNPKHCFFFGAFFCLYVILLFWVLLFSYSFSFIEMHFFLIGGSLFGKFLCIVISVYIRLRSSLISHQNLNLKSNEKITKMSIYRCLEFYRQQSKTASTVSYEQAKKQNRVYTNCTLIFKKKGINSYIEGLYNFKTHFIKFILGFISTLFTSICIFLFEISIDGFFGMRSTVLRFLNIYKKYELLELENPPSHYIKFVHQEILNESKSLEERMLLRESFKDPSFKKEEIEIRLKDIIENRKCVSLQTVSIYKNLEKSLSEKSVFYFVNPKNYIKLKKLCNFCQNYSPGENFSMGVKELWNI